MPALVVGPISVVIGVVDHLALTTFLLLCEKCGGVIALLSGLFQLGNSICRVHLRHWSNGRVLRLLALKELLVAGLMPLLIASVALLLEPSIVAAFTLPGAFAVVSFLYEPIETGIFLEVSRLGLKHGTEEVAGIRGVGDHVKESTTLLRRVAAWLLHREPGKLSRMRRVVMAATTIALLSSVLGAAAAFGALFTAHVPLLPPAPLSHQQTGASAEPKHRQKPKPKRSGEAARPKRSTGPQGQTNQTPTVVPSSATWEDVCPTEPGYDAPSWVGNDLNALYLGRVENADPPPGAFQGGCTGRTHRVDWPNGPLYYTIGTSIYSQQRLSVAVVSSRYGPAIFLSPAPKLILSLLAQGPLGGEPRQNVGNGDIYLVHNEHGVTVLIRRTKTITTTSTLAQPYVELLPAAAQAWFDAIRRRARTHENGDVTLAWLWPVETLLPDGSVRFRLLDPTTGSASATIIFDPVTDSAELKMGGESFTYTSPNTNFTVSDLKPFLPLPPPPAAANKAASPGS